MEHKETFNAQRGSKIPLTLILSQRCSLITWLQQPVNNYCNGNTFPNFNVVTAAMFTNVLDSAP